MTTRLPVLFLGHGSPMTVISDVPARRNWIALGKVLPRPKAILVITAHWETRGRTHVTSEHSPRTIHDFRGFPQALFDVQYPAPGSAELVERVAELLGEERMARDTSWGFDHGAWGVMQPMFPDADIPMVAMSIDRALSPDQRIASGAVLAPLRDEGVLIVASGNLVHNITIRDFPSGTEFDWAVEFRDRIVQAVGENDSKTLTHFGPDDQGAALAVNSAEHYLPLLYAVGARLPGDDVAVFSDTLDRGLAMTSFLLGDAALASGLI